MEDFVYLIPQYYDEMGVSRLSSYLNWWSEASIPSDYTICSISSVFSWEYVAHYFVAFPLFLLCSKVQLNFLGLYFNTRYFLSLVHIIQDGFCTTLQPFCRAPLRPPWEHLNQQSSCFFTVYLYMVLHLYFVIAITSSLDYLVFPFSEFLQFKGERD